LIMPNSAFSIHNHNNPTVIVGIAHGIIRIDLTMGLPLKSRFSNRAVPRLMKKTIPTFTVVNQTVFNALRITIGSLARRSMFCMKASFGGVVLKSWKLYQKL